MRWSSVSTMTSALFAVILACGSGQAQESPGSAAPAGQAQPRTLFQSLNQFSAVGGTFGLLNLFGGDLGADAKARPLMQAAFRYRFSDRWIGTSEPGFGWSAFKAQGDTVLTFTFGTIGAARRLGSVLGLDCRASAGIGYYRWHYKHHGRSLRDSGPTTGPDGAVVDPGTQRRYKGLSPGGYLGGEAEYRLTGHVTLLALAQMHYVLTADKELFNYLFDQNHGFLGARLGAVYHFSPYEGILWERKQDTRIRLESGREGR